MRRRARAVPPTASTASVPATHTPTATASAGATSGSRATSVAVPVAVRTVAVARTGPVGSASNERLIGMPGPETTVPGRVAVSAVTTTSRAHSPNAAAGPMPSRVSVPSGSHPSVSGVANPGAATGSGSATGVAVPVRDGGFCTAAAAVTSPVSTTAPAESKLRRTIVDMAHSLTRRIDAVGRPVSGVRLPARSVSGAG